MPLTFTKLHPLFVAEVGGIDASRPVPEADFTALRAALDEHAILVLRDQTLDDESQIAFSRLFGPLEKSGKANPATGTHFARQSNLDIATGGVIPPEDRRMEYQKGNYLWHTDSSFKAVPSLCSLLSARIVPPEGGNTEFADMRAAYDALPDSTKAKLEGRVTEHSLVYSRGTVSSNALTPEMKAELPGAWQSMVRTNPVTGRKAIYAGNHASHVIGWPREEGRAFINELNTHATQPQFCYSHRWRDGDLVIWDNRAVLHRATPYDAQRHKRLMQRTTVTGDGPTTAQPAQYELAAE